MCVFVWRYNVYICWFIPQNQVLQDAVSCVWVWVGLGVGVEEGRAKVHGVYECNGENCMLGVIPTRCVFVSSALCITVYIHYLRVAAAQLYSLSPLTSRAFSGTAQKL